MVCNRVAKRQSVSVLPRTYPQHLYAFPTHGRAWKPWVNAGPILMSHMHCARAGVRIARRQFEVHDGGSWSFHGPNQSHHGSCPLRTDHLGSTPAFDATHSALVVDALRLVVKKTWGSQPRIWYWPRQRRARCTR